jgi:hypothetical protein
MNSFPVSQKTACVFISKTSRLMLLKETIAVHSESHKKKATNLVLNQAVNLDK